MEQTGSTARRPPAFISSAFKWAILSSAIVFSLSGKGWALFSSQLVYSQDAESYACGRFFNSGILDADNTTGRLGIYSSYIPGMTVRNTVTYGFDEESLRFSLGIDGIFLPAFEDIDDTGVSQTITPFALTAPFAFHIANGEKLSLSLGGHLGVESVGGYYTRFLYFGNLRLAYRFTDRFGAGAFAGYSDEGVFVGEAAAEARAAKALDVLAGFELNGFYKTAKLGAKVRFDEHYGLLLGGDYTFEYGGWLASAGFFADRIRLGSLDCSFDVYFAYTGGNYATIGINIKLL